MVHRLAEEILEEYNSTIHTVTEYTPYFLLFAEERHNDYLREPVEDIEPYRSDAFVKSSMDHKRNQLYYDKRRKNWQFSIGNEVTSHIENMKPLNTRTGYRGYTIIDDESIESDE
ncbi:hypothetical protein HUG17_2568 [Dermatophagoides farinae]|uniref:Uncharacterized protein n=1 Tax=Dermatophagoides farinae TaxID=6954 RepID=A0A9D4NSS5_DERFA|nr:hypothetical protein HUG17_2568 [Dermatophagoides farinae]